MKPSGSGSYFATPADGLRTALPILFAYIPLGFAAGVVGARAGMSPAEVALLSILVFAGVSQFIFADMVGGSPIAVVTTVFLVNFRHFLYSTALTPKFKRMSTAKRSAIGAQLTDEGFALMSLLYKPGDGAAGVITLNVSCYFAWLFGNIGGAVVGDSGAVGDWGADYLLIAMFAGLLMLKITAAHRKAGALLVLAVAAALSVGLELLHPHPLNILLSAGVAAAGGAVLFGGGSSDEISEEINEETIDEIKEEISDDITDEGRVGGAP